MNRIRVVTVRKTVTLIVVYCCIASSQIHASFQSQRLMKGTRNRDNHNTASVFGLHSSQIKNRNKKRDKKHQKVQPLKNAVSIHQLQQASYVSQANEVNDERSSRQKNQPTAFPSSSPTISSNNNKNSNDKQQKAPASSSATFTVSPVSVPIDSDDKAKTSNAPARTPTIRPVPVTPTTETPTTTSKPILSIPLDVPTSPAPTTFFNDLSNAPTITPIATTKRPATGNPTAQPSPILIVTPITTTIPTVVSIVVSNNSTTEGKDVVLEDDPTTAVADITTTSTTTHSNGKAKTGTIVGVVLGVILSMIVSLMVLKARHKYVQKYGAASTRRRRNKSETQEREVTGAVIDDIDDELHNIKTVHIITNLDHDTADVSPDRTYEIHLEDDDDAHVYSQESSFLSTSGGEEIESDLDRNVTTTMDSNSTKTTRNNYDV